MMHAEKTCRIIAQFSGIIGEFEGTIDLLFVNKKNRIIQLNWAAPSQCFIQKGGGGGGGEGGISPQRSDLPPQNPQNKKMILTQLYNLQSDSPVILFKSVKDFIKKLTALKSGPSIAILIR